MVAEIQTRIEEVVIFRDQALVLRSGRIQSPKIEAGGELVFAVAGLPLLLDDASLRFSVDPAAGLLPRDVRVELAKREWDSPDDTTRRGEVERLARRSLELREKHRDVQARIAQIEGWIAAALPGPPIVDGEEQEKPPFPVAAHQEYLAYFDELLAAEQDKAMALSREIVEGERELEAKRSMPEYQAPAWVDDPSRRFHKRAVVRLGSQGGSAPTEGSFQISYCLPGARWAPIYQIDVADDQTLLRMGARVVQRTSEDWQGVRLRFSGASLRRVSQLPELPSRRIGREQPARQSSMRPPPEPAADLFAGFRGWRDATPAPRAVGPRERYPRAYQMLDRLKSEGERALSALEQQASRELAEGTGKASDEARPAPRPAAPPPSRAPGRVVPPPPASAAAAPKADKAFAAGGAGAGMVVSEPSVVFTADAGVAAPAAQAVMNLREQRRGFAPKGKRASKPRADAEATLGAVMDETRAEEKADQGAPEEEEVGGLATGLEPLAAAALDYRGYRIHGPEDGSPGTLQRGGRLDFAAIPEARTVLDGLEALARGLVSPGDEVPEDVFYVYETDGLADVPADGAVHGVAVASGKCEARMRYLCAPAIEQKVFRRLELKNPFDFPLPSGEAAVYLDGAFAFTTRLPLAAAGSETPVPLGVEERIKVARNARYEEEQSGVMSSGTAAVHHIEVEAKSAMPRTIELQVLDRVPFTDEKNKQIKLQELPSEPRPESLETLDDQVIRGLRRFVIELAPGKKEIVRFGYKITIPAKMEIVGGNRRE